MTLLVFLVPLAVWVVGITHCHRLGSTREDYLRWKKTQNTLLVTFAVTFTVAFLLFMCWTFK